MSDKGWSNDRPADGTWCWIVGVRNHDIEEPTVAQWKAEWKMWMSRHQVTDSKTGGVLGQADAIEDSPGILFQEIERPKGWPI